MEYVHSKQIQHINGKNCKNGTVQPVNWLTEINQSKRFRHLQ